MTRDQANRTELLAAGWRTAVVWECALKEHGAPEVARALHHWLRGTGREFEAGREDELEV